MDSASGAKPNRKETSGLIYRGGGASDYRGSEGMFRVGTRAARTSINLAGSTVTGPELEAAAERYC